MIMIQASVQEKYNMIRQVIAKIDCGDEYCEGCRFICINWCGLFDHKIERVDTKRCDACKKAEGKLVPGAKGEIDWWAKSYAKDDN